MKDLIEKIIKFGFTKVSSERFNTIERHYDSIQSLEGDIIECGVWKGGMGMYLSERFPKKQLWLSDSFTGFQHHLEDAIYPVSRERHHKGGMSISYNSVLENFNSMNIPTEKINWLQGYVKDTLPTAGIDKIALLRIDVDAYSATREVLDNLYHKVVTGGYIIFDDTCLEETTRGIKDFFTENKLEVNLRHPVTDSYIDINSSSTHPCGCYVIKI